MKKILLFASALAGLFLAGSCQKETLEPAAQGGVTYEISLPDGPQTKGEDGYATYDLHYEVYKTADANALPSTPLLFEKTVTMEGNTTTVTLDLLNDQDYTILFWANKQGENYFDLTDLRQVGVRQAASNNDDRDAFCGMDQLVQHDGAQSKTVELKRPFAQINIATLVPTVAEIGYDVTPLSSLVKVKNIPVKYNVFTGEPVGDEVEVDYTVNIIPAGNLTVNTTDYKKVAMNYALVPATQDNSATVEVYYEINTVNGTVKNSIPNVPVKKNYRTNIIGNLLTSSATYNIVLLPGFEDGDEVRRIADDSEELAAAVADAKSGETIYIDGTVTMPYFTDKALTFVGLSEKAVVKQSPATHIDAFYAGAELNFKNVTLVGTAYTNNTQGFQKAVKETYTDCKFQDYIMFAGDVTIVNNCEFTSNVGQYFWTGSADNITFNECTFNGLDRAVKVCTVGNAGERVVTFTDCEFSATTPEKAAIEIDGSKGSSYVVNINGCTHTGFAAGANTGDTLFNVIGAENVTVYVDGNKWTGYGVMEDENHVKIYTNTAGLLAAIEAAQSGDVLLLGDAKFDGIFHVGNKSLTLKAAEDCHPEVAGRVSFGGSPAATLTCENLKLSVSENTGKKIGNQYYDKYVGYILGNYCGNLVVKNCEFTGMTDESGAIYYYSNTAGVSSADLEKLTVENCTFNGGRAIRSRANVTVTGSTFTGLVNGNPCLQVFGFGDDALTSNVVFTGNTSTSPRGVCVKTSNQALKNVTFNVGGNNGCNTITFDSKNLDNFYPQTYTYSGEVDSLLPEDTKGLNYLIGKGVGEIDLIPGATYDGIVVMKSNVTIDGAKAAKVYCVNLNGADYVTLKDIIFDAVGATYGYDGVGTKKDYAYSNIITGNNVNKPNKGAHNLVIDGCKFTGAFANPGAPIAFTDQKRGEGGSGNITIKNCVFENTNANYTIYGHYTGDSMNGHGNFVIENNTFNSACYAGPIYLGRYASNVPVKVTGNAFETVTSIDYAIYVQDHSSYGVSYNASNNTFAN